MIPGESGTGTIPVVTAVDVLTEIVIETLRRRLRIRPRQLNPVVREHQSSTVEIAEAGDAGITY